MGFKWLVWFWELLSLERQ